MLVRALFVFGLLIIVAIGVGYYFRSTTANLRAQRVTSLRHFALALSMLEKVRGGNVPNAIRSEDDKPLLSWRVMILPYIEQVALYEQFRLDEPWDSPHNLKIATSSNPYSSANDSDPSYTSFLAILGDEESVKTIADFGASRRVIWTAPDDSNIKEALAILDDAYYSIPFVCRGGAPLIRVNEWDPEISWIDSKDNDAINNFSEE